jgi:hypothetical protein
MDVRLPSGVVIRGIPEGTPKDAIRQKAIAAGLATEADFGGAPKPPPIDPTNGWGSIEARDEMERFAGGDVTASTGFGENVLAGIGGRLSDMGLASRQMMASAGSAEEEALLQEAREKAKRDEALMQSGGGMVGSGAVTAAEFLLPGGVALRAGRMLPSAASLIPAALRRATPTIARGVELAAPVVRGAAAGGTGGAAGASLDPTEQEGEREANVRLGAGIGTAGGALFPAVGAALPRLLDRTLIIGSLRREARAAEQEAATVAAREAREAAEAQRRGSVREAAAERARAKAAREAEEASTQAYREAELRGGLEQLSGGKDPTTIAGEIREEGIRTYRTTYRKLKDRYDAAEAPRPEVKARVTVDLPEASLGEEFADHANPLVRRLSGVVRAAEGEPPKSYSPKEVRDAIRAVREQIRKAPYNDPKVSSLRTLEQRLEGSMKEWSTTSTEAAKQWREMRAVDRLFNKALVGPSKSLGMKASGEKLPDTAFPSTESILTILRNQNRGGAVAERILEHMPASKGRLREMVGALGTKDIKQLESDLANRALSKMERDDIKALLAALKGG